MVLTIDGKRFIIENKAAWQLGTELRDAALYYHRERRSA